MFLKNARDCLLSYQKYSQASHGLSWLLPKLSTTSFRPLGSSWSRQQSLYCGDRKFVFENTRNAMEDVKQCLLKQKENSDADFLVLEGRLNSLLRKEVVDIARQLNVKRAGASKKGEIVARLLAKSRLGILAGNGDKAHEEISISYITPEISKILSSLPKFSDVFEGWSKEVGSSLENFHFVHLHAFLVESRDKTFDAKSLRAFKSLKGYTFFADGFVRNVWLKTFPDSDVVYFRSYVFHSLTVDTPLTVFVCVSKSCGDVYSAQCNCVAGLGASCNHIAALLFALERYARDSIKLLPDEPSKTSLPMSWNQPPRKIVKPSPVSDIVFTNFTYSCKSSSKEPGQLASSGFKFDPRPSQQRNLDAVLLQNLQDELNESFPESAFLSFWADIPAKPLKGVSEVSVEETLQGTVIEPLLLYVPSKSLLFASSPPVAGDELTDDECEVFVADQVIDQKTVDVVERSTRGQAGNDIWHLVRYGRLTSSRFGELLHRRETTSSTRLVTEIMGYKENTASRSRAVSWGRNNENNALKAYTITRNAAVVAPANISVHLCGLNLLATHSYIGASSDGIVFGEKDTGCVEVKCPYSIGKQPVSDMAPLDIAKRFPQFYLKRGTDGKLHLDHDHHYYAQVQGEMAVIGVSWCDFIVFTAGGLFIERIPFDNQFWLSTLLPALETFFTRHVAPEILTRRILKSL